MDDKKRVPSFIERTLLHTNATMQRTYMYQQSSLEALWRAERVSSPIKVRNSRKICNIFVKDQKFRNFFVYCFGFNVFLRNSHTKKR